MGIGVGINALNWLGFDMYYSSSLGFGGNMQLTPFSTFGGEISYKEGISLSIGVINGDTTHEINFNIGWGTIISAAAIAVAAINSERDFRKTQQKISNNIENSLQMIA